MGQVQHNKQKGVANLLQFHALRGHLFYPRTEKGSFPAFLGPARGDSAPRRTYANTQLKQENVPIAWLSLLLKAGIIKEL